MRVHVLGALVIFVGLSACGKDPNGDTPPDPTLRTDRDSLGFGQEYGSGAYIGTAPQETLLVENLGAKDLVISSVDKTGDSVFAMELPQNLTVQPSGHTFIRVIFTPTEVKQYQGALVIHSNAANDPQKTITLSGRGVAPDSADGGP